jgi:hypothetical protein
MSILAAAQARDFTTLPRGTAVALSQRIESEPVRHEGSPDMIAMMERGARRKPIRQDYTALTTEQLLLLHERHFAPLDRKGKRRIIDSARRNGWDRCFGMDGLAA